jgi:hypothetical protein
MNATVRSNICRRLEQHFADLADDGVPCAWTTAQARQFEAAANGPYTDDQAQEAVDRLVDYSRTSRTVPRPEQLVGYLRRATQPEPPKPKPKAPPKQLPKDPMARMFGWKEPDHLVTRTEMVDLVLDGAGDSQFARDVMARKKREAQSATP